MRLEPGRGTSTPRRTQAEVAKLRASGWSASSVAAEVLLLLPEDFVRAYESLYLQVVGEKTGGRGDERSSAGNAVRTETGGEQTMRVTGGAGGSGFGPRDVVRSERARGDKDRVDRKLRKIARELLQGERVNPRRCGGAKCRRFADPDWSWCPFCGSPTENLE